VVHKAVLVGTVAMAVTVAEVYQVLAVKEEVYQVEEEEVVLLVIVPQLSPSFQMISMLESK
jgi:hypothetical protein